MKYLFVLVFLSVSALGQNPAKMITFDRANTDHCKVVVAGGKPLLESTYEGTSVTVGMPVNRGNGEFAVFIVVSRIDPGSIQVNPRDFYGLYSDPSHTRFAFYDKAAELGHPPPSLDTGMSVANSQAGSGPFMPGPGGPPPGDGPPGMSSDGSVPHGSTPSSKGSASGSALTSTYLHGGKIQQGGKLFGWIILRQQTKKPKLEVGATDMLDEVDIPIDDTIFRF